jgi:hypothetical protein
MSDSNRTKIGYRQGGHVRYAPTTPRSRSPHHRRGLTFAPVVVESKELRADRMIGDLIRVGNDVGGSLPLECRWLVRRPHRVRAAKPLGAMPVRDNNGTAASEITDVVVTTGVYNILTTGATNTDNHFGAYAIGHLVRASGFRTRRTTGSIGRAPRRRRRVTLGNVSVAEASPPAAARLKVVGFRGTAGDITATATGLGRTALDFTTLGLQQGQWIKVGGSGRG